MKPIHWIVLLAITLLLTGNAVAADFDGSKPLICALMGNFECDPDGCERVTSEGINMPQFVRIDFEGKKISAIREGVQARTTPIEKSTRSEGTLYLQGLDKGMAWSIVIAENDGKMGLTVAGDQMGFMIFGACTTP
jgi:hypothetical protein